MNRGSHVDLLKEFDYVHTINCVKIFTSIFQWHIIKITVYLFSFSHDWIIEVNSFTQFIVNIMKSFSKIWNVISCTKPYKAKRPLCSAKSLSKSLIRQRKTNSCFTIWIEFVKIKLYLIHSLLVQLNATGNYASGFLQTRMQSYAKKV